MIPPELAGRTWLAVRDRPNHRFGQRYGSLRAALAANPGGIVVSDEVDGWTWVFAAPDAPILDPKVASQNGGEACRFSLVNGRLEVARYKDGVVVRRVAGAAAGGPPQVDEGLRGHKREPPLTPFDADTVLAMARAWRCDPVPELDRTRANGVPAYARARPAPTNRPYQPYAPARFDRPSRQLAAPIVLGLLAAMIGARSLLWRSTDDDPGSQPTVCVRYECNACMSCAIQPDEPCGPLAAECGRDPACIALSRCYDACNQDLRRKIDALASAPATSQVTMDDTCERQCEAEDPAAVATHRAWVTCAACDVCTEPCEMWMRVPIGDLRRAECAKR